MNRRSGTNTKSLVLRCMPLMDKGAGSAWGLPVIASGKERFSALSLSENLEAPFAAASRVEPFQKEKLRELEKLGIGALGRYVGGEAIKPAPLSSEDFFARGKKRRDIKAAELFCTALEFEKTYWTAEGSAAELFHDHLEFLRTWGFSGGVHVDESLLAPLLAGYVRFLQSEAVREHGKIIVLVPKAFFETKLCKHLPNAKLSANTDAGEIPVNLAAGGIPVLSPENSCLGIALYEDSAAAFRVQKIRCDILITVNTAVPELSARLTLSLSTEKPAARKTAADSGSNKTPPLAAYLCRNLFPAKQGGNPEALPFPAFRKTESGIVLDWGIGLATERSVTAAYSGFAACTEKFIGREKAEALGILPQWEAGRVESACGAVLAVNAKFSGLRAAGLKEEQAMFYAEGNARAKQSRQLPPEVPPIPPDSSFSALNEIQFDFFLRWRNECRHGHIRLPPGSPYIETYIRLYAEELALCMGKESPLQHFSSLTHLFHASSEQYPETAALLCKCCIDFIVIYGLAEEAFPILLSELFNSGWFSERRGEIAETEDLLTDLAISFFFIESDDCFEKSGAWPILRRLIPPRILHRKEHDESVPARCCRTLSILDTQLRADWRKRFFTFFLPPLPCKVDFTAFEKNRLAGSSSYTVCRPGFSSHKPLIDVLSALVLNPDVNPLPELKARLHQLSLENELIEELRKESDEVRDILKTDEAALCAEPGKTGKLIAPEEAVLSPHSYIRPNAETLAAFILSLTENERQTIQSIMGRHNAGQAPNSTLMISGIDIDSINTAFYKQFGDLLIEPDGGGYSISEEYTAILDKWE